MTRLPSSGVDPSSLIFVVIVVIWAVYLLGHWVRRRDQLALLESVDRFSATMRVLERRPPVPAPATSRPRVHAAPARPVGPTPVRAPVAPVRPRPSVRSVRPAVPRRAPARARWVLGGLVLGLLVAVPVSWVLAAVGVLGWWVAAAVTGSFVAFVAGLRGSARRARALARRRSARQRRALAQARRAGRRVVVDGVRAARRGAPGPSSRADDVSVPPLAAPDSAAGLPEPDDGWQPVPVPPPTYTLKERAPGPDQPPLVPTGRSSVDPAAESLDADAVAGPEQGSTVVLPDDEPEPAAADPAPSFDLDAILERRIASNG